jgi:hypothetical protein
LGAGCGLGTGESLPERPALASWLASLRTIAKIRCVLLLLLLLLVCVVLLLIFLAILVNSLVLRGYGEGVGK